MKRILILITLLAVTFQVKSQSIKNIVFKGGGIRGIAYGGAIEVLENKHMLDSLVNIGGTSVGAITATLLAVGYTSSEIIAILGSLKVQKFNDGYGIFVGGAYRTWKHYGWYRGNRLETWIEKLIAAKTGFKNTTFTQLHELVTKGQGYRDLYITGTNLSRQRATLFSYKSFPEMELHTAVRISMSIPVYFSAVFLDEKGERKKNNSEGLYDVYVDGGVAANYPLDMFDSIGFANPHTLGIKLERPKQLEQFNKDSSIAAYPITDLPSYIGAMYNLIIETLNRKVPFANEAARTIYISTGNINPRVKKIPKAVQQQLLEYGRKGAQEWLKN